MKPMAGGGLARELLLIVTIALAAACGDDDDEDVSEAHQKGVGIACASNDDCPETAPECLTQFRAGYCGVSDCAGDQDCPQGSACVVHDDGNNYCFLSCSNKPECNYFRPEADAANCSSNIDFVERSRGGKACVPPSSGD
ncbi:MAG TPA: hypothetical protein VI197_33385 [Polyangiaceae bacterium]